MTRGMILGKFLPPHLGHVYLGEFAQGLVDELDVVVGTLAREPIPGALRHAWMTELFPRARVHHLAEELPQEPAEHPEFWRLWREALLGILPAPPDVVFASEAYGHRLAAELGARFVPVDPLRTALPISGTRIREAPCAHFAMLPRCVRPYFVRRVVVFGPESTGKSTLAAKLARHYGTVWVPEYARTWLETWARDPRPEDMPMVARGQAASEDALARDADRVLFADTDPLSTLHWSEALFGAVHPEVRRLADTRAGDLYLLGDVDVPFVEDPIRYLPGARAAFFERSAALLAERGRRVVILRGGWEARWRTAVDAVDALLAEG
jgi:NadR type nicotinamide-nucleotide adenylyltransferase